MRTRRVGTREERGGSKDGERERKGGTGAACEVVPVMDKEQQQNDSGELTEK